MASEHATNLGHQVDTPTYYAAIASKFAETDPKLSTPAPAPVSRGRNADHGEEPQSRGSMYSAPPSRDYVPSASGERRPGTIRLSVEQKDMARRLGQSEVDYARGLIAMRELDKEFGK